MGLALSGGGRGVAAAPTRGGASGPPATFRMFAANRFSVRGESEADQVGTKLSVATCLAVLQLGRDRGDGCGRMGTAGRSDGCVCTGVRACVCAHAFRVWLLRRWHRSMHELIVSTGVTCKGAHGIGGSRYGAEGAQWHHAERAQYSTPIPPGNAVQHTVLSSDTERRSRSKRAAS